MYDEIFPLKWRRKRKLVMYLLFSLSFSSVASWPSSNAFSVVAAWFVSSVVTSWTVPSAIGLLSISWLFTSLDSFISEVSLTAAAAISLFFSVAFCRTLKIQQIKSKSEAKKKLVKLIHISHISRNLIEMLE